LEAGDKRKKLVKIFLEKEVSSSREREDRFEARDNGEGRSWHKSVSFAETIKFSKRGYSEKLQGKKIKEVQKIDRKHLENEVDSGLCR
jgi:hypothetical protein